MPWKLKEYDIVRKPTTLTRIRKAEDAGCTSGCVWGDGVLAPQVLPKPLVVALIEGHTGVGAVEPAHSDGHVAHVEGGVVGDAPLESHELAGGVGLHVRPALVTHRPHEPVLLHPQAPIVAPALKLNLQLLWNTQHNTTSPELFPTMEYTTHHYVTRTTPHEETCYKTHHYVTRTIPHEETGYNTYKHFIIISLVMVIKLKIQKYCFS